MLHKLTPYSSDIRSTPGNLHTKISGDYIQVPRDILNAVAGQRILTAEDLFSFLETFPSTFMAELGWTFTDCRLAATRLKNQMMDIGYVFPQPSEKPAFGAINPNLLVPFRSF
jgi:hypothetical protein